MYWILFIGISLISWLVQSNLKSKFEKYSKVRMNYNLRGRDVAARMLGDNGIDATIRPVRGSLTDFFNPADMSVNLSESVYASSSVAAAAVAAHE